MSIVQALNQNVRRKILNIVMLRTVILTGHPDNVICENNPKLIPGLIHEMIPVIVEIKSQSRQI